MLLITHDFGLVAGFAERVVVMYAGRVVEERDVMAVFGSPAHPYTSSLLRAVPRLDRPTERLESVGGAPPAPSARPPGCSFQPRCPLCIAVCSSVSPRLAALPGGGQAACHLLASEPGPLP